MKTVLDFLREYRNGRAIDLISERLAEVTRAVDETGKAGEVTIVIKVKPDKGGGSGKTSSIVVKSKRPEYDIPEAVFFSDTEGNLHRTDPAQMDMPLAVVRSTGSA